MFLRWNHFLPWGWLQICQTLTTLRSLFSPHDLSFCLKSVRIKDAFVHISPACDILTKWVPAEWNSFTVWVLLSVRGRTWALEGSELDRSGERTICKHPFPFLFTCQDSRSRLFSARPCTELERKQLGSQLQFLNLAFYSLIVIFKCLDLS